MGIFEDAGGRFLGEQQSVRSPKLGVVPSGLFESTVRYLPWPMAGSQPAWLECLRRFSFDQGQTHCHWLTAAPAGAGYFQVH